MAGLTLTAQDVAAVNAVIDAACAPSSDTAVPWDLVEALDRLVPCDEVSLVGTDSRVLGHYFDQSLVGRSQRWHQPFHEPRPYDGEGPGNGFWGHFWEDPCSLPERTGRYGDVRSLSDLFTDVALRNHRIYTRNLGPRGLFREALLVWPDGPGRTLRLLCWRGPGSDFTGRERFLLRLLRPHIAAAYEARPRPGDARALSARQTTILRLVALGLTNTQIAHRLAVSEGTVRTHLNRINERLGAGSRTDAVMRAIELQLLEAPSRP